MKLPLLTAVLAATLLIAACAPTIAPSVVEYIVTGEVTQVDQSAVRNSSITVLSESNVIIAEAGKEVKLPISYPRNLGIEVGDRIELSCKSRDGDVNICTLKRFLPQTPAERSPR